MRYIRKTNIEACTFEQAIHANPDSCVVMAGTPRWLGELAILLNSFRRVVFFTYMGENEEALRNILETYERAKGIKERDEYFLELFKRLNVDKKAIPNWLIEPDKKARVEIIPTQKPAEAQSRIRVDAEGTHIPQKHIKVVFKDMQSGSQATRYYSKESMLPSFDRTSRSRLVKVTHLRKGDVVFGIQADRGLLEIMCTTYGLDSKVDMDAIKEYYSTLISHAATTSVKSFYSSYCTHAVKPKTIEEFRLWLAQYVIGPELAQDIEAIGRAMDNEHIVLNSAYIFDQIERVRSNHQEMGKMIKKHISQIISRRGLTVDSFKDHVFLESLPIYRVVRIEKKT